MKKILITGASGFLGLPIVREICASGGYEIYAVTSGRRNVKFPAGVNKVTANLLDREQSKRLIEEICPEIMLHLAWELSEPSYLKSASNLVWLEESLHMLRIFTECQGKYFAFAGSSAEYGRFSGFSENGNASDISLYGQCKNAFHKTAVNMCDGRIDYVNLRFFPVLGQGIRAVAAAAAAAAAFAGGKPFICKAPNNIWDFISIDDASKAAAAVINKKYTGVVNIGSGTPRIMGEVFKTIAKKMDCGHLLSLDFENTSSEILVANTNVLNNVIGYKRFKDFDETLDDLIYSILAER